MVWYGMVWYGMVWYGMVWYGMVWYGMVWYGMVWYGMVWYGMVWYGMVWYGMVWYGMVWYGMVLYLTTVNSSPGIKYLHIYKLHLTIGHSNELAHIDKYYKKLKTNRKPALHECLRRLY